MLSYAGIQLNLASPELVEAIEAKISPRDVFDFERLDWPGKGRINWTWPGFTQHRPIKVGTLYWPRGAMRFAVGYFLCTETKLAQIRTQVYGASNDTYVAKPLSMSKYNQAGTLVAEINPDMWMLPPRPIFQQVTENPQWRDYYLITLVDDRYFWWFRNTGSLPITEGTTTWANLYESLDTAAQTTIDYDTIDAKYLTPNKSLASYYEPSCILMDAVAYNVGQRVVRLLDGTVEAVDPVTAKNQTVADLFQMQTTSQGRIAGGTMALAPGSPNDTAGVLPESVTVTFPKTVDGQPQDAPYAITVTMVSLGLSEFSGANTSQNTKTFHDSAAATDVSGTITNLTSLTNLAKQIATDWYRFQLCNIDIVISGIFAWRPDGWTDSIEWTYRIGEQSTRVQRPPWNDLTETLCHGTSPPDALAAGEFWARIDGSNGVHHSWTEMLPGNNAVFTVKPSGKVGTLTLHPGFERNRIQFVPTNKIVKMYLGYLDPGVAKQEYIFEYNLVQFQENGVNLPIRPRVNVRNGLLATDDIVNHATVLDWAGGSSGSLINVTIQKNTSLIGGNLYVEYEEFQLFGLSLGTYCIVNPPTECEECSSSSEESSSSESCPNPIDCWSIDGLAGVTNDCDDCTVEDCFQLDFNDSGDEPCFHEYVGNLTTCGRDYTFTFRLTRDAESGTWDASLDMRSPFVSDTEPEQHTHWEATGITDITSTITVDVTVDEDTNCDWPETIDLEPGCVDCCDFGPIPDEICITGIKDTIIVENPVVSPPNLITPDICTVQWTGYVIICDHPHWVSLIIRKHRNNEAEAGKYEAILTVQKLVDSTTVIYTTDSFGPLLFDDPNAPFVLELQDDPTNLLCDWGEEVQCWPECVIGDAGPDPVCDCDGSSSDSSSSGGAPCWSITNFDLTEPNPNIWHCNSCCWTCLNMPLIGGTDEGIVWEGSIDADCELFSSTITYTLVRTADWYYLIHIGPASLTLYGKERVDWDEGGPNSIPQLYNVGPGGKPRCVPPSGWVPIVEPICCDPEPCGSSSSGDECGQCAEIDTWEVKFTGLNNGDCGSCTMLRTTQCLSKLTDCLWRSGGTGAGEACSLGTFIDLVQVSATLWQLEVWNGTPDSPVRLMALYQSNTSDTSWNTSSCGCIDMQIQPAFTIGDCTNWPTNLSVCPASENPCCNTDQDCFPDVLIATTSIVSDVAFPCAGLLEVDITLEKILGVVPSAGPTPILHWRGTGVINVLGNTVTVYVYCQGGAPGFMLLYVDSDCFDLGPTTQPTSPKMGASCDPVQLEYEVRYPGASPSDCCTEDVPPGEILGMDVFVHEP